MRFLDLFKKRPVGAKKALIQAEVKRREELKKQERLLRKIDRSGYEIKKAWIDETGVVCVRLYNGDWYHYYEDGTWG